MLNASTRDRLLAFLNPQPVRWRTVVLLAVLMAYADGYWLESVAGAVGAIERTQSPFTSWLRDSTLVLPFVVLGVLVALGIARRRFGPTLTSARAVVLTGLLIVAAGVLVTFAQATLSALYDYHLQAQRLAFIQSTHPGHASLESQLALTREADNLGVRYGTGLDLVTNLVLVWWVLAAQGGRLVAGRRRQAPSPVQEAIPVAA